MPRLVMYLTFSRNVLLILGVGGCIKTLPHVSMASIIHNPLGGATVYMATCRGDGPFGV